MYSTGLIGLKKFEKCFSNGKKPFSQFTFAGTEKRGGTPDLIHSHDFVAMWVSAAGDIIFVLISGQIYCNCKGVTFKSRRQANSAGKNNTNI